MLVSIRLISKLTYINAKNCWFQSTNYDISKTKKVGHSSVYINILYIYNLILTQKFTKFFIGVL